MSHRGNGTTSGTQRLRILIIDDEPLVLRALGRLLSADGHGVRLAATAELAWREAAAAPVDLIVIDVGLGAHTASTCLEGLRKRGVLAPAIAISGLPAEDETWITLPPAERPLVHVTKPVTREELRRTVRMASRSTGPEAAGELGIDLRSVRPSDLDLAVGGHDRCH